MSEHATSLNPTTKALFLAVLMLLLAIVGVFVIAALRVTWQRFISRQKSKKPTNDDKMMSNVWELSGQRLVEQRHPNDARESRNSKHDRNEVHFNDDEHDDEFWRDPDREDEGDPED